MSESESPFLDFLVREGVELRRRLMWCVGSFMLISGLMLGAPSWEHSYAIQLFDHLQSALLPLGTKLVFLDPLEPMVVVFKLSMLASLVLTAPILIWHVFAFTAPALAPGMRSFYGRFVVLAILLFALGLWLTYRFMLPLTLHMLMAYGAAAGGSPMITFERFYSFSLLVLLAFALPFETPLLMGFLHRFNIVDVETMRRWRLKFYGVFILVAQFVTPDPIVTPLMFIGMMIVLFESGLLLAKRL